MDTTVLVGTGVMFGCGVAAGSGATVDSGLGSDSRVHPVALTSATASSATNAMYRRSIRLLPRLANRAVARFTMLEPQNGLIVGHADSSLPKREFPYRILCVFCPNRSLNGTRIE